jgi:hypothetical protein
MIFKHLFRSKHQSSDPQVRLQAIEKLNNSDPEQKSILHELAFNDSDVNVSLAALQKLDSFVLWYKMSETAKNDRVQKKSQQFIENALLDGQSSALDANEKRRFILETRDSRLVEKLLSQVWVQQDTELALALLKKTDKPQLHEKLLFQSQNTDLTKAILSALMDNVQSRKLLNKFQKKSASTSLKAFADELLQGWLAGEKAPVEVEQQVKMLLSRLLALKDHNELPHLKQQQSELTTQYLLLSKRFDCLPEQKRIEIEAKYADISARVERTIALLIPQWQAKQAELALADNLARLYKEVEQNLADLSVQLSERLSDISAAEVDVFTQKANQQLEQIHTLTSQLPATKSNAHKQLEQLNNQLVTSLNTLASLPKFQKAIQQGQAMISKFAELPLPDDVSQIDAADEYLKEQKQIWRHTVAEFQAHLPADLSQQWHKQIASWQQAIKTLKKQIDNDVSRCRNKIRAVESLVNQGKFKAAMGLYQKVNNWYQALPEKQQGQLERSFSGVKQQIENLKDWQEYIAAPRKPALLTEVAALVANPLTIEAQVEAIKSLRYQWNSLGKIDTESDIALNEAFESEIEKAFAPCRAYYDQQQQEREQNMQSKQHILAELTTLSQQEIGTSALAKRLSSLQQKWRNIGEVDFKLRNDLYQSYQQLLTPLKDKVTSYQADNAQQKRQLIDKVTKLIELESVTDAIEQAKVLQEKWKSIEHAGKQAENQLWSAFRQANDNLFAKRNEANQQQKDEAKQQVEKTKQKLVELETELKQASDKSAIQNALQDQQQVMDEIAGLPVQDRRALEQKLQAMLELQKSKLTELKRSEKSQQLQALFDSIKSWKDNAEVPDTVNAIAKHWQSSFYDLAPNVDRHDLTIKMEIVAQADSPEKDAQQRQSIQMQMMAQKLQSGDELALTPLFKEWISAGAPSKTDLALLKRIEPLVLG